MQILSHPNQIRVGFQKRDDTYNGLLSYIIFMNGSSTYGKEKSFNKWIDGSIPIQDIPNDFKMGFVLNKTVSRQYYSSSSGVAAFRIYHPNGYEFEISPYNFANICSQCNISSGEIMEPCTLAWDGAELTLIPESFIKQNLVSFKEIDILAKLNKHNEKISQNIQSGTFIPVKKLKADTLYMHDNGREYFLSGNVKNKSSILNHHNFDLIDEQGTIRSFFNKGKDGNNYRLFPFAIDGKQDTIVDDDFMSHFVSIVNTPLSTVFKTPEHFLSIFLPFHQKINIKPYDGSASDKKILLDAANVLKNRFVAYDRDNEEYVLPLTISINNFDYLIALSFGNIMSNFNFSDAQKNILKKHNLTQCDYRMLSYRSLSLNFVSPSNNIQFSIVSLEVLAEIQKMERKQKSLFNQIANNPLNLIGNLSNIIKDEESNNVRSINYEKTINQFIEFLNELMTTTPQNTPNLEHFIIKVN